MAQKRKFPTLKRKSVKTFGFFLFFSAVVWVLVQFSKTYVQLIEIPIIYVNIPLDKSISDEKPEHIDLQIQDNGYSIYYYKWFKPKLEIDLSKATENDKRLVYNIRNHLTDLEDKLNVDLENSRIVQDEIVVPFDFKKERTVKIIPNIEVSYAVGYSAEEDIRLKPDTVRISGPQTLIDSIENISTVPLDLNRVNTDLKGTIKLDTTGLGMLSFYTNEVEYLQNVAKFTEGQAEVPVEVINVPAGLNLAYFPKTVIVYYQISLKKFDQISDADFKVVCDYSEVEDGDDYMVAKITEKPSTVQNERLNERRIQFVIKR